MREVIRTNEKGHPRVKHVKISWVLASEDCFVPRLSTGRRAGSDGEFCSGVMRTKRCLPVETEKLNPCLSKLYQTVFWLYVVYCGNTNFRF